MKIDCLETGLAGDRALIRGEISGPSIGDGQSEARPVGVSAKNDHI